MFVDPTPCLDTTKVDKMQLSVPDFKSVVTSSDPESTRTVYTECPFVVYIALSICYRYWGVVQYQTSRPRAFLCLSQPEAFQETHYSWLPIPELNCDQCLLRSIIIHVRLTMQGHENHGALLAGGCLFAFLELFVHICVRLE